MTNIFIFTQNVILTSFDHLKCSNSDEKNVFLTTHMLLENERAYLQERFSNCIFIKFADLLSDAEAEKCDKEAYNPTISVSEYYERIKENKNIIVRNKILNKYPDYVGYICSDDLGVCTSVWSEVGFTPVDLEYYYKRDHIDYPSGILHSFKRRIKRIRLVNCILSKINERKQMNSITDEIYVAYDTKGYKYVFVGKLSRIEYRTDLDWKKSDYDYSELKRNKVESSEKCQYLTTLHESWKCVIPDNRKYDVRYIQDGYLPPNYTSLYLKYHPQNVQYYSWDVLGKEEFINHNEPVSLMPFRKILLIPQPIFKEVKTILVATSGPGDWTAIKNRSDEDLMFQAFLDIARKRPDINIIYRCHPTWTHPDHNGVNSINRLRECIEYTGLKNIKISSNIPLGDSERLTLSFSRSSFDEDLAKADIVFGEHSVSMIDAAFKKIPFASVNLTGRRNLFCGITNLGFPHCESVDEILDVINSIMNSDFQHKYLLAVKNYNLMSQNEDEPQMAMEVN